MIKNMQILHITQPPTLTEVLTFYESSFRDEKDKI